MQPGYSLPYGGGSEEIICRHALQIIAMFLQSRLKLAVRRVEFKNEAYCFRAFAVPL